MTFVSCSVPERLVNPLFEVFDGGDFILSSYRDIEEPFARMRIFIDESVGGTVEEAKQRLQSALDIVGGTSVIEVGEIADEDWKYAYRRHFKTEPIGERLVTVPEWEFDEKRLATEYPGRCPVVLDPGMAFGTGKHETTKACLEYIDELLSAQPSSSLVCPSFLDMGSGSGILSIAAAKLGAKFVKGFDVDQEAVDASIENAAKNKVVVEYAKFALGSATKGSCERQYDIVAANILGPLLIKFADEIALYVKDKLILSGILTQLYPEVLATYESRGFREVSSKTIGEWTTGLYQRQTN